MVVKIHPTLRDFYLKMCLIFKKLYLHLSSAHTLPKLYYSLIAVDIYFKTLALITDYNSHII